MQKEVMKVRAKATPKVATQKVATPKKATPKVATPKVATPKVAKVRNVDNAGVCAVLLSSVDGTIRLK